MNFFFSWVFLLEKVNIEGKKQMFCCVCQCVRKTLISVPQFQHCLNKLIGLYIYYFSSVLPPFWAWVLYC